MAKWSFATLAISQWTPVPPLLTANLSGKSVLVVGASAGIGLEAAIHFARMSPARLIVTCRNEQKGRDTVSHIAKVTSFRAEAQIVELADFESVRDFVTRLKKDPLDIVVANAGTYRDDYRMTKDGWEETLQVNHLSTALMSLLLVPNLLRAAELHGTSARLVIVASELHYTVTFDDELLSSDSVLRTMSRRDFCTGQMMDDRHSHSKLLNVLFTRAFAQHLNKPSSIIPTSVNPGLCTSQIGRNLSLRAKIWLAMLRAFLAWSSEVGSRQLVWAALGPDGKDGKHVEYAMHGSYVSFSRTEEPSDFVISEKGYEAQEKIWNETVDILSQVAPGIQAIVDKQFRV